MRQKQHVSIISSALQLTPKQVENTIKLLDEGATIPFISRYRKEQTGNLDEVQVSEIKTQSDKLKELDARKQTILSTIEEQGKLTDELRERIVNCYQLAELEDIYLPYKPKRRTRAIIAREKGLEPLADLLSKQYANTDVYAEAVKYLSDNVENEDDALAGARDIIAEWVSEDEWVRNAVRKLFARDAIIATKVLKGKDEEGTKYRDYFDFSELLYRCPSHRFLAIMRGVNEGFLKMSVGPDSDKAIGLIEKLVVKNRSESAGQMQQAVSDSCKRLIMPSLEAEFIKLTKDKADEEAIRVFAENLRQLLLASPLGEKTVLAIDPGYRTGCKVVCLDAQGNLLHNETIYPHSPQNEVSQAARKITALVDAYKIEAIAIGNGTASRETEHFIKKQHFNRNIQVFVVSEDGASVYSASTVAREEFPQYDVTVRGAVSIGRRLIDPLSELVKIDPKSIGVGQYQHDVDQTKLKQGLNRVVESCVNKVGVNLNTASKYLLVYISGLGPQLAQNIVDYRKVNGTFKSRNELKKVARLGPKAFEQSAGFLRIADGINPLDNSAVHPESYPIVEKMAKDLNTSIAELLKDGELQKRIDKKNYITPETGELTLNDILGELTKPSRDPRTKVKVFEFAQDIYSIEDVHEGMELPGIVTNITNFGAFVDIGIKQDGLVHVSQMADAFITNPADVVKLHQHVKVKVLEVDIVRKRIQLSMKGLN
ncbi:MAG: RNA-binding transcriptional accessory protein [Prevotellaceae bacterium]|jgi:uncharacterized protein|nr:RNA-binding transcriptional accessory protein [Prevotellaceae bacterium]